MATFSGVIEVLLNTCSSTWDQMSHVTSPLKYAEVYSYAPALSLC